jgi:predicted RNA-binding protein YlxR (DUF448 family)
MTGADAEMSLTSPTPRKHIPQRTCVACRQAYTKRELTRLVYAPEGGLHIDRTGKMHGRGAYLCGKPTCWDRAYRSSLLEKALKVSLNEADKRPLLDFTPHS